MSLSRWLGRLLGTSTPEEPPQPPTSDEFPAPVAASDPRQHAHLLDNPDDDEAWRVYADWLTEQGDPRGKWITLQMARETADSVELRAEENALLHTFRDHLTGGVSAKIRRGFATSLEVDDDIDPAVLSHPVTSMLRELRFGVSNDVIPAFADLFDHDLPTVRRFVIDFEYPDDCEMSWFEVGSLEDLLARFPNLEHLELQGADIELGTLNLPKLKHLEIRTGGLLSEPVDVIVDADLPALETLLLWFGEDNYGRDAGRDEVRRLLATDFPALKHLGIQNCDFVHDMLDDVVASPLLKQLETLSFAKSSFNDTDVPDLVRHADSLSHLEQLDFAENLFHEADFGPLQAIVTLGEQRDYDDPDERYCAVGE